jgi:hypothetical protein
LWRELTVAIKPLKEQICRMTSALGNPWRDLPGTEKSPTTVAHRITFKSDHPSTTTGHRQQRELHRNYSRPAFQASTKLGSRRTFQLTPECSLGQQIPDPDDKAGWHSAFKARGIISQPDSQEVRRIKHA